MRRALMVVWASVCGCATAVSSNGPGNQESSDTKVARCRLVGAEAGTASHNPREAILDEKTAPGPTKVIWIHPQEGSLIRTAEGYIYRCDRIL